MSLFLIEKGEQEWLDYWSKYEIPISTASYRLFSKYIGNNKNIVPLELFPTLIEPVLTPLEFYYIYNEKNLFNVLFRNDKVGMPKVYLRNIQGTFYNENYHVVGHLEDTLNLILSNNNEVLVLKPTIDSNSGKGVKILNTSELNLDSLLVLLSEYKENYILQEGITQSSYLSQFNKDSVNTIRLMGYRSVKDNVMRFPNAVLRIGKKGSKLDNSAMGGMFCGIDSKGKLGKFVVDYYGNKEDVFNEVNFKDNEYVIPNYDKVIEMAKEIGENVYHSRLVAYDIAIDNFGNPLLIEINVGKFSAYFYQFTSDGVFGEYTEEVLEYCKNNIEGKKLHSYVV
ncbi:hypothetical protein HX025_11600 [Myroides odoratimimus]|uniref:sugar-transfer associated ATP-grasp domain-containing protein n=1 Tax=Myroides odoratimimus TaxID=76832 RepID=UPI0025781A84|nr:sugar-transfer associated ATP-grasp domain-containing protein [Myroides odoratimimus]MDM1457288.1 hypothetical protein [Myroides odoratimimus]